MRLYYAFVTGIGGWLGVSFYEQVAAGSAGVEVLPDLWRKVVILFLLFLSWGINQIVNDFLGLPEDRINAPRRPMVTGELNPVWALAVTGLLLMATGCVILLFLEPVAMIPFLVGITLNIVYEHAKAWGWVGNLVFGVMITMTSIFGFLASGPTEPPYFTSSRVSILVVLVAIHGVMTFFTYFKDFEGDRAVGKRTLVVRLGVERSRRLGLVLSILPSLVFLALHRWNFIEAGWNPTFLLLGGLSLFLQIRTAVSFYRNPVGEGAYRGLATNFRAGVCAQATFIALYNRELALQLFLGSYVLIGFLFGLHKDAKA
ncbi:MAG: UbiA family prenyltransferase [Fibrobacteria bacterium]|nr:UbiA family prenyltransferase [Fibrobacteria bacterium]